MRKKAASGSNQDMPIGTTYGLRGNLIESLFGAYGPVAGLVGIEVGVVSVVINIESPALKRRPGDNAMKNVTSKPELSHSAIESTSHLFDTWCAPLEDMIRGQVRGLIEEMI